MCEFWGCLPWGLAVYLSIWIFALMLKHFPRRHELHVHPWMWVLFPETG